MNNKIDMIGKQFQEWTILKEVQERDKQHGTIRYLCKCSCGKEQIVNGYSLRKGISKYCLSCREKKKRNPIKNKSIRLYNIYNGMISRCYYKKSRSYKNYGERGIKVCDEWLGKYGMLNFYNWAINNGYKDDLSIDRIDNNGNYEPNNCRWATRLEQQNNTSTNRLITYNGETKTLAEWSRILKITSTGLRYRLKNWDIKRAFEK